MFNSPAYYIVLLSALLALIVLLVRMIIQRRKEEKVFREYMAEMNELRKQKNESEANGQNQHKPNCEQQETERHVSENPKKEAGETTYNEREKKDSWTAKVPNILKTAVKWYLIFALFPLSLFYLFYRIYREQKKRYEEAKKNYEKTAYFFATKIPYDIVARRPGVRGEYLLYKELRSLEAGGAKFLFNTYIPKGNGETSEIDIICICHQGIFVFESKDYSGWIYGHETQEKWTQTFAHRRGVTKVRFNNPVRQNQTHIKYLRSYLQWENYLPIWSVIVFSNRCELKQIEITRENVFVVQCQEVYSRILTLIDNNAYVLSKNDIDDIYRYLYPLTQVSDEVKRQHNENVRMARGH